MNKEEIYDEQISPLMQKIISVCREHGIAMIASFLSLIHISRAHET